MEKDKEEKGEFRDYTTPDKKGQRANQGDEKEYKNKVVFLRKSKKGEHLYAFDYNDAFKEAIEGSIIMNISDVEALIEGRYESIKVSIMAKKELGIPIDGRKSR